MKESENPMSLKSTINSAVTALELKMCAFGLSHEALFRPLSAFSLRTPKAFVRTLMGVFLVFGIIVFPWTYTAEPGALKDFNLAMLGIGYLVYCLGLLCMAVYVMAKGNSWEKGYSLVSASPAAAVVPERDTRFIDAASFQNYEASRFVDSGFGGGTATSSRTSGKVSA